MRDVSGRARSVEAAALHWGQQADPKQMQNLCNKKGSMQKERSTTAEIAGDWWTKPSWNGLRRTGCGDVDYIKPVLHVERDAIDICAIQTIYCAASFLIRITC
jgi:hypothetical protein